MPENRPKEVTVTVRVEDAYVLVLGPLDYTVATMEGRATGDGSIMNIRHDLLKALRDEGYKI